MSWGFFFLVGVWVTALVTLVVYSVLTGVGSATAHVLEGGLTPPRHHHIVEVYCVMPGPQHPLIYPQESSLKDKGFDQAFHMPDGEAGDGSEALIGNPGVLAKEVCFGEYGAQ